MGELSTAAVDADFVIHIAQIKRPPVEAAEILSRVLTAMELCAVVHPLVYQNELDKENDVISNLFCEHVLKDLKFDDIFQGNRGKEAYYQYLVSELYRHLKGESFPLLKGQNVLTYWKHQASLGEIHSVAMCLICEFDLFLSDDRDSKALKQIVKQKMLREITIYNRQEVLEQCKAECGLSRTDRRAFAHKR